MKFLSLFAGIGGFDLGFERAGLECIGQCEIDEKARGVLEQHWPHVPKFADIRELTGKLTSPVDVVVGGFPCQDLSQAGRRAGLAGGRSGLFYEMVRLIDEIRPAYAVWENVPGLLNSDGGRDFARVLQALGRIGYSGSWRGLDARYFGLAQRRRRIFGVFARSDIGTQATAEILSLIKGLRRPPQASRKVRTETPTGTQGDTGEGSQSSIAYIADVSPTLGAESFLPFKSSSGQMIDFCIAFWGGKSSSPLEVATTLNTRSTKTRMDFMVDTFISEADRVRCFTPVECERLQGFPDNWTKIGKGAKMQSDRARYKQIGNAVAVPVVQWIAEGIVLKGAGQ